MGSCMKMSMCCSLKVLWSKVKSSWFTSLIKPCMGCAKLHELGAAKSMNSFVLRASRGARMNPHCIGSPLKEIIFWMCVFMLTISFIWVHPSNWSKFQGTNDAEVWNDRPWNSSLLPRSWNKLVEEWDLHYGKEVCWRFIAKVRDKELQVMFNSYEFQWETEIGWWNCMGWWT